MPDRDRIAISNATSSIRRQTSSAGIIALAAVAAIWLSWKFSPGFMSFDSLAQYRQMLGVTPLTDNHPVIMVYVWRLLYQLFDDAGVMLAFHQAFYWATICLFSLFISDRASIRLLVFLVIGLCPPLLITSLMVWKDVGMLCGLGMAVVGILGYVRTVRVRWLAVSLVSLTYAIAVRVNGFIPALPLLIFISLLLCQRLNRRGSSRWRLTGQTVALSCMILLGYAGIDSLLGRGVQKIYALGTLTVWDMGAISMAEQNDLLPHYLHRSAQGGTFEGLKSAYSADANFTLYRAVSPYPDPSRESQLTRDWLELITQYPLAYLRHRAHVLKTMLGIGTTTVYYPYHPGIDRNDLGLAFRNLSSHGLEKYQRRFHLLATTILYRGWFYLLVIIVALGWGLRRRILGKGNHLLNDLAVITALGGLGSAMSLFIVAPAADFRYMTWTILSALMSMAILIFTNERPQRAADQNPPQFVM